MRDSYDVDDQDKNYDQRRYAMRVCMKRQEDREISKDNADNMALWQEAKFISGSGKVSLACLGHFEEIGNF